MGRPYNKDYNILRSTLGPPILRNCQISERSLDDSFPKQEERLGSFPDLGLRALGLRAEGFRGLRFGVFRLALGLRAEGFRGLRFRFRVGF